MARTLLIPGSVIRLFNSVSLTHRALNYHLERHNVLASNVANVDTPGFTPMELMRQDTEEQLPTGSLPLRVTHGAHYTDRRETLGPFRLEASEDQAINAGNDGNSVSLERESSKLAANQLRYEGAIRIVRSQLGMLRYASNDGH